MREKRATYSNTLHCPSNKGATDSGNEKPEKATGYFVAAAGRPSSSAVNVAIKIQHALGNAHRKIGNLLVAASDHGAAKPFIHLLTAFDLFFGLLQLASKNRNIRWFNTFARGLLGR